MTATERCLRVTAQRSDILQNRESYISFASMLHGAISILHNGIYQFRISPLIFMKIKSGEWKRVYKRKKERIKDDCLGGKQAPIRIVDYLRFGRRFSVLRAEQRRQNWTRTTDGQSMIFQWSRGQHTESLSLNARRGSLGFYY